MTDVQYKEWKKAFQICCESPETAIEVLKKLAAEHECKLLNWRSPVNGMTLLHALVSNGASPRTLEQAVELGCDQSMKNAGGETPAMIASRKGRSSGLSSGGFFGARSSLRAGGLFGAPSASVKRKSSRFAVPSAFVAKSEQQQQQQPLSLSQPEQLKGAFEAQLLSASPAGEVAAPSPPTGSLVFASTSGAPAASGSLFGVSSLAAPLASGCLDGAPTSGSIFSSPASEKNIFGQPTSGSLFGQTSPSLGPVPASASVSIFGQVTSSDGAPTSFEPQGAVPASGGLFGQASSLSSASTGVLFGQPTPATSAALGGAVESGGLFGQASSLSNSAPAKRAFFGQPASASAANKEGEDDLSSAKGGASSCNLPRSIRKSGRKLDSRETVSVPSAKICLDMDFSEEQALDQQKLALAIRSSYGGSAQVQIDEVSEKSVCSSRAFAGSGASRVQNVKCRVMFNSVVEAGMQQEKSSTSRDIQDNIAANMNLDKSTVEFDAAAKMNEVDALTLKLDSDSTDILCGACLLYNDRQECEKVVCYTDRSFWANAIEHSGDTRVDGKSVHTLKMVLSKLPPEISQLYFTLCSCGPADLSHFKNPNIMLYENREPDANLLEYSIGQAAKSASCVMARMLRQPLWSKGDSKLVERCLRQLRMPLLCIDMALAMAAEDTWAIQALGTEEWNIQTKICGGYDTCKALIEKNLKDQTSLTAQTIVMPNHKT